MGIGTYLDLDILINGGMDALLLIVTGRVLNNPIKPLHLLSGTLFGEIPVFLALGPPTIWLTLSKVLTPLVMIWITYPTKNLLKIGKTLTVFWLLSSGLGGFVYALWGWIIFQGAFENTTLNIAPDNFWLLPLAAFLWWGGQWAWQGWRNQQIVLDQVLYDLEIDFGEGGGIAKVKALLDTGNHLRDPLSNVPIILLEEEVAAALMPERLRCFLQTAWQESPNPWPCLWKGDDPLLLKSLVFIPYQGIGHQNWLLGVRPKRVSFNNKGANREVAATIALVQQVLSSEGIYQALLHPEHIQEGGI